MKKLLIMFFLLIPIAFATPQLPEKIIWDFFNGEYFTIQADTILPSTELVIVGDLLVTGEILSSSPVEIEEGILINGTDTGPELTDTVFTGSGTNNFYKIGDYNGSDNGLYEFEIDGSETFKYTNDSGDTYIDTGVAISSYQSFTLIHNGIKIKWDSQFGHTLGDKWTFTARQKTTPPLINATQVDGTNIFTLGYDGTVGNDTHRYNWPDLNRTATGTNLTVESINITGCDIYMPDGTLYCNNTINVTKPGKLIIDENLTILNNLFIPNGIKIGNESNFVDDAGALAIGQGAYADYRGVVLGYGSKTTGSSSIAIGQETNSSGITSLAFGWKSSATGNSCTAVGRSTRCSAGGAVAIGLSARATGNSNVAIGELSYTQSSFSTSVGDDSESYNDRCTSIGFNTQCNGAGSTALGSQSSVYGDNSFALYCNESRSDMACIGINATIKGELNVSANITAKSYHDQSSGSYIFFDTNGTINYVGETLDFT